MRLRFEQKASRDSAGLRDGSVDLETGVVGVATSPELRESRLFTDRFVGVVHSGHPLSRGRISARRYASGLHIAISRRGRDKGPADEGLLAHGLERDVVTMVADFSMALALARDSELIATVPERHTGSLRTGMHTFTLPFAVPPITVSMLWHPRMHADPVHRWFRERVREVCAGDERGSSVPAEETGQ